MASSSKPVVLSDFVNTVPSPLTFALVSLSDKIAVVRQLLQILNWRSKSWFDGFLAVAAWCAFCAFATTILRYLLPAVILSALVYTRRRHAPGPRQEIVTESLLQNTIADLNLIPVLLPSIPNPFSSFDIPTLARAAAILYIPYLAITCFLPLYIIFSVAGAVTLTWQAPFSVLIRNILCRSAYVRWSFYALAAFITGRPLPPKSVSPRTQLIIETNTVVKQEPAPTSLRFLFTLYENQRWWMGLDWTAALLPGERPSWCSASQAPLTPPGAFTLPEPTATYIPHPTDPTKKIKRTAEWHWEEPEWRVLVKKEGAPLSRVEKPVPTDAPAEDESSSSAKQTSSRLFKAAHTKFNPNASTTSLASAETHQSDAASDVVEGAAEDNDGYTDPDGWIYGDNKWENKSNKGGMSKYTRYRRWTRVAVLTEFTQVVDATPENTPDRRAKAPQSKPPPIVVEHTQDASASSTPAALAPSPIISAASRTKSPVQDPAPLSPAGTNVASPGAAESPLRQRLRAALGKPQ